MEFIVQCFRVVHHEYQAPRFVTRNTHNTRSKGANTREAPCGMVSVLITVCAADLG